MKLSLIGRTAMATLASLALGLGMTACGGGTIGYLWVLGDQYNQITGYKIDQYTGNLTQVPGSPFTSNGVNPTSIVVKSGGRFVYVVNTGTGGGPATTDSSGKYVQHKETSGGVAVYSVGGEGILTFQQTYLTQGQTPVWAQIDGTGSYLYVLDKYSPKAGSPNGSITVFAIDSNTGRLTLQTNSAIKDATGAPITYFEVGRAPIMMKTVGGCLFTVDSLDNTIFPYATGSAGQLTIQTTGLISTGASALSSINGSSSLVFLTDSGANKILPFTVGSNCSLQTVTGGIVSNLPGTSNPVYSMVDTSNKYVYVLNQSTVITNPPTTPFSTISAFNIVPSTQQLSPIPDSPYTVGSGPVCMVEDPTGQYVYTSNRNDGTVTGKILDPTTGKLSDLSRGSTFPASGLGGCLAVSGVVQ